MIKEQAARTRMSRDERRQQLIEVALDLFAYKGFSATTTKDISQKAKVSESVIYSHFKSKRDLFIAVIRSVNSDLMKLWRGVDLEVQAKPYDFLLAISNNTFKHITLNRQLMAFSAQLLTEMSDPEFNREFSYTYRDAYRVIKHAIARGKSLGHFRKDLDVEMASWMLVNSYLTVVSVTYMEPDFIKPDMPQRIIDTILGAMKKD